MPTVGPENEAALWGHEVRGQAQGQGAGASGPQTGVGCDTSQGRARGGLRHQLGTVVGQTREQVPPAPSEEPV